MRFPIAIKSTFSFDKFELGAILSINLLVPDSQEGIPVATFLLTEHEFRRYKFKTLFSTPGTIIAPGNSYRQIGHDWVDNDDILKLYVTGYSVRKIVGASRWLDEEAIKPKFYLDILGV